MRALCISLGGGGCWDSTHSGATRDKKDAFVNDAPWFRLLEGDPPCPWAFALAMSTVWATLPFGVFG